MTNDQQTITERIKENMNFDVTPDDINNLANKLRHAEAFDGDDLDTDEVAQLVSALKNLESVAEDARKDHIEPVLADRVEIGGTAYDLTRMESSRRYVVDDAAAFDAVLDADVDPREVAKVNVGDLVDALGQEAASEFIGESSYDYFRRQG